MNDLEVLQLIRWTAHQLGSDQTLDEAHGLLEQYKSEQHWPKVVISAPHLRTRRARID